MRRRGEPFLLRLARFVSRAGIILIALGEIAWAAGALAFDLPHGGKVASVLWTLAALAALLFVRGVFRKFAVVSLAFALVLGWWFTLQPRNDRTWQPDVAETAWAEIDGDRVTIHNVRNCEYRTETNYTPRWETRTVQLSQLTGLDLAINYWGSPWMAHPIASFQFADAPPLCLSIETRKEVGESYSAVGGLYRQFELIYVVADERDVVRVRTNFRKGEDVYLYRTRATPEQARQRFMEYLDALNSLHVRPRWYHALSTNCTTAIRNQRSADQRAAWDWRILANGKGDEMMFDRGLLASGGLPFAELKKRARINDAALAAGDSADFSRRIRAGRPGF